MKLALAAFLFLAVCFGLHGQAGPTVLAKGLFSYQAPPGWKAQDSVMSKYPVCLGTAANGFAPNINVVIENSAGSLDAYAASCLQGLKSSGIMTNVRVVSQQPCKTAAGLDGRRVVVTDTLGKFNLQQMFYLFDGGSNAKLVVTASCLADDATVETPLFDAALKSFTLE